MGRKKKTDTLSSEFPENDKIKEFGEKFERLAQTDTNEKATKKNLSMLSFAQKKEIALNLYLHSEKTHAEIAELAGVVENTILNWKREGNWDKLRDAKTVTAANNIALIHQEIATLLETKPKGWADDVMKLNTYIAQNEKKNLSVVRLMDAGILFMEFVKDYAPDKIGIVSDLHKAFISKKLEK